MGQPLQVGTTSRSESPWGALVRVLYAPVRTFDSLGDHPPFLPPYLTESLVSLPLLVGVVRFMPSALAERGLTGAPTSSVAIAVVFTAAVLLLGPWIVGAINAVIAGYVGRFFGGGVTFAAYFGMIGYGRLPIFVGSLLNAGTSSLVPTSFSFLVPKGSNMFVWAFMNAIGPLDLWYYGLLAVGFSKLHKTSMTRSLLFPLTLFCLSVAFEIFRVTTVGVPGR